jgi:hypothetical protein
MYMYMYICWWKCACWWLSLPPLRELELYACDTRENKQSSVRQDMCECIHANVRMCIPKDEYTCIHACMHSYTSANARVFIVRYTNMKLPCSSVHDDLYVCIHALAFSSCIFELLQINTRTYVCIHVHVYTYIYMHTYIHTCVRMRVHFHYAFLSFYR